MSAPQHSGSPRRDPARPSSRTRSGDPSRVNAGRPRHAGESPRHGAARTSSRTASSRAQRQGNRTSSTARTAQRSGRRARSAAHGSGVQPTLWTKEQRSSSRAGAARERGQVRSSSGSAFLSAVGSVLSWLLGLLSVVVRAIGRVLGALLRAWFKLVRNSKPALIVSLCAIALVVVFSVDGLSHAGRAYSGVKVGDIDVSGLTAGEIVQAVDQRYNQPLQQASATVFASEEAAQQTDEAAAAQNQQDAALAEQMAVDEAMASKKAWQTTGADLGATLDSAQLAEQALAVGRGDGGLFARMGAGLFGKRIEVEPSFDEAALEEFASGIDAAIGQARVDYDVKVSGGVAYVVQGNDGWEVNRQTLAQLLSDTMLGSSDEHIIAHTEFTPVRISSDDAAEVAQDVTSALSGGARFKFEGHTWQATAAEVGAWVSTAVEQAGDGWRLRPYIDQQLSKSAMASGIRQAEGDSLSGVGFEVNDAGAVSVTTDGQGKLPDVSDAAEALSVALFGQGDTVYPAQQAPEISVDAEDMPQRLSFQEAVDKGVVGPIGSFTTTYTTGQGTENRNHNIELVSQILDNSVCKSGETWSYNNTTGDCNEEKGFLGAGAIINGEYTDSVGGGICQVATTVFDAVYESGLPVVERHNHSLYIASYPAGRDAAVSYPDLDLVWRNDTASDVLVKVSTQVGSVTATLYGVDPGYQVTTETGQWEAGKKYSTTTKVDDTLAPGTSYVKTRGTDGSTIEVTRTVKDVNGNIVRQDLFASVYDPINEVILKGPDRS